MNRDYRAELISLVDGEMVDKDILISCLCNWMSQDDIRKCLQANDITLEHDMDIDEDEDEYDPICAPLSFTMDELFDARRKQKERNNAV